MRYGLYWGEAENGKEGGYRGIFTLSIGTIGKK